MNMVILMGKFKKISQTNNEKLPFKLTISVRREWKELDGTYKEDEFDLYVSEWWRNIEDVVKDKLEKESFMSFKCHLGYIEKQMVLVLEKITCM